MGCCRVRGCVCQACRSCYRQHQISYASLQPYGDPHAPFQRKVDSQSPSSFSLAPEYHPTVPHFYRVPQPPDSPCVRASFVLCPWCTQLSELLLMCLCSVPLTLGEHKAAQNNQSLYLLQNHSLRSPTGLPGFCFIGFWKRAWCCLVICSVKAMPSATGRLYFTQLSTWLAHRAWPWHIRNREPKAER